MAKAVSDSSKAKMRENRSKGAKVMNKAPGFILGALGALVLLVAIVNWIYVSLGFESGLLKSYFVDEYGHAIAYDTWTCGNADFDCIQYKLYYWDVWAWLTSMERVFKNLGESFVSTFGDFAIHIENDSFFFGFANVIILILNLVWSVIKIVVLFPLSLLAAVFQAFMSSWIDSDGWLTQAVTWHIPYVGSNIVDDPVGWAVGYVLGN